MTPMAGGVFFVVATEKAKESDVCFFFDTAVLRKPAKPHDDARQWDIA